MNHEARCRTGSPMPRGEQIAKPAEREKRTAGLLFDGLAGSRQEAAMFASTQFGASRRSWLVPLMVVLGWGRDVQGQIVLRQPPELNVENVRAIRPFWMYTR